MHQHHVMAIVEVDKVDVMNNNGTVKDIENDLIKEINFEDLETK